MLPFIPLRTFPVYPLLTTSMLYWIISNTSTTYTTWPNWPSYSLLHYLLPFPTNHNLGFIHIYSYASIFHKILPLIKKIMKQKQKIRQRISSVMFWMSMAEVIACTHCSYHGQTKIASMAGYILWWFAHLITLHSTTNWLKLVHCHQATLHV